jgi:hypothetical protein
MIRLSGTNQGIQRVLFHEGVGIEQEHVFRWVVRFKRRADHGVVAARESPVGIDDRQFNPRTPAVLLDCRPQPIRRIAASPVLA